jgi:hypothetical protein
LSVGADSGGFRLWGPWDYMMDSLLWLKTQAMGQLFVSRCLKSLRTIYGVWRLGNTLPVVYGCENSQHSALARLATLAGLAISHALAVVRPRLHHGPAPL